MDEQIVEVIKTSIKRTVKEDKLVGFEIATGKEQMIILEEFDCDVDGRLYYSDYFKNSLTAVVWDRRDNKVVGKATFYLLDYSVWNAIEFWEKKGLILHKRYLRDCILSKEKKVAILGYGQISHSVRNGINMGLKRKIMEVYCATVKAIINVDEYILFCEPCGVFSLNHEVVKQKELDIRNFNQELFGVVHDESVVSEKLMKVFDMEKIENCYQLSTLGSLYLSRNR